MLSPGNDAGSRPAGVRAAPPLSDRPMSMVLDGKWGGGDWTDEKDGGSGGADEGDESLDMIKVRE